MAAAASASAAPSPPPVVEADAEAVAAMAARVGEAQASPEDLPTLRASLTALGALLPQLLPTTDPERALCRAAEPYIPWVSTMVERHGADPVVAERGLFFLRRVFSTVPDRTPLLPSISLLEATLRRHWAAADIAYQTMGAICNISNHSPNHAPMMSQVRLGTDGHPRPTRKWIPASPVEFRQNAPPCPPYPRRVPSSL